MSLKVLELPKYGPAPLQEIHALIQNAINERTPVAGEGCDVDYNSNGAQICIPVDTNKNDDQLGGGPGGGSSGTNVDIYGALNGQPALYHLVQTSAPDPV